MQSGKVNGGKGRYKMRKKKKGRKESEEEVLSKCWREVKLEKMINVRRGSCGQGGEIRKDLRKEKRKRKEEGKRWREKHERREIRKIGVRDSSMKIREISSRDTWPPRQRYYLIIAIGLGSISDSKEWPATKDAERLLLTPFHNLVPVSASSLPLRDFESFEYFNPLLAFRYNF